MNLGLLTFLTSLEHILGVLKVRGKLKLVYLGELVFFSAKKSSYALRFQPESSINLHVFVINLRWSIFSFMELLDVSTFSIF